MRIFDINLEQSSHVETVALLCRGRALSGTARKSGRQEGTL